MVGRILALVAILALSLSSVFMSGCGSAEAQSPTPPSSAPSQTLSELSIGNVTLTPSTVNNSASWSALDYVPTIPAVRSELRLFPLGGDQGQTEPGGELTLSQWNLKTLNAAGDYQLMAIYAYPDGYRFQSQAGGNQKPLSLLFDAVHGAITFRVNSSNGSVGIAKGVSNTEGAGGFAHQRTNSCIGATCQTQITWQTAFEDTNYTATCTLGGSLGMVNWTQKQTGFIVVTVNHLTGSDGGEIDCIGVHD